MMTLDMQKLARSVLALAESMEQAIEVYAMSQKSLRVEVSDGE